jgi:hypothetical protein
MSEVFKFPKVFEKKGKEEKTLPKKLCKAFGTIIPMI